VWPSFFNSWWPPPALHKTTQVHQFTIVGEDEADIDENKISWISPLARVLLGKKAGDTVQWKRPSGDLSVRIDEIVYQ